MTGSLDSIRQTRSSVCGVHGDYIEKGVQASKFFKSTVWLGCVTCNEARESARQARLDAQFVTNNQRDIEVKLNAVGIPDRFKTATFENFFFDEDPEKQKIPFGIAERFNKKFTEEPDFDGSLVLSGSTGTGKTHLACAIASAHMHEKSVMFLSHIQILNMITASYRFDSKQSTESLCKLLGDIDLLIVDELGANEVRDNSSAGVFFEIFNRRYASYKSNIFLTNSHMSAIVSVLGQRMIDRIKESGYWAVMEWPSQRGKYKRPRPKS